MFTMLRAGLILSSSLLIAIILGCGGAGTVTTTAGQLCGSASYSPNYTSSLNLKRWTSLPIKVYFKTNTAAGGSTLEARYRQGFNQWETETGVDLWQEVTSASEANLTVETQVVAPQSTLGVTTIYFFSGQSTIQNAEMIIYSWPSLPLSGYAGTAAHEMGHALGLNGHSPDSNDLMYFTGNSTDLLTVADVNTLRANYCSFGASGKSLARTLNLPLESERIECPAK